MPDFGEVEIFTAVARGLMDPVGRDRRTAWCGAPWRRDRGPGDRGATAVRAVRRAAALTGCSCPARTRARPGWRSIGMSPETLADAGIPLVLLDRSIEPYPTRGHHDLVALDNRRAGALVTSHLLAQGCRRVIFSGCPARHRPWMRAPRDSATPSVACGRDPASAQTWREDPADSDRDRQVAQDIGARRLRLRERPHGCNPDAHAARSRASDSR